MRIPRTITSGSRHWQHWLACSAVAICFVSIVATAQGDAITSPTDGSVWLDSPPSVYSWTLDPESTACMAWINTSAGLDQWQAHWMPATDGAGANLNIGSSGFFGTLRQADSPLPWGDYALFLQSGDDCYEEPAQTAALFTYGPRLAVSASGSLPDLANFQVVSAAYRSVTIAGPSPTTTPITLSLAPVANAPDIGEGHVSFVWSCANGRRHAVTFAAPDGYQQAAALGRSCAGRYAFDLSEFAHAGDPLIVVVNDHWTPCSWPGGTPPRDPMNYMLCVRGPRLHVCRHGSYDVITGGGVRLDLGRARRGRYRFAFYASGVPLANATKAVTTRPPAAPPLAPLGHGLLTRSQAVAATLPIAHDIDAASPAQSPYNPASTAYGARCAQRISNSEYACDATVAYVANVGFHKGDRWSCDYGVDVVRYGKRLVASRDGQPPTSTVPGVYASCS